MKNAYYIRHYGQYGEMLGFELVQCRYDAEATELGVGSNRQRSRARGMCSASPQRAAIDLYRGVIFE